MYFDTAVCYVLLEANSVGCNKATATYSENWRVKKKSCLASPVQIIVRRNQLGSAHEGQSLPNKCVWTSKKFKN